MGKREPLEGNIFTRQSKKHISFLQIMIHYHLIDMMIKIASNLLDLVSIYVLKKKKPEYSLSIKGKFSRFMALLSTGKIHGKRKRNIGKRPTSLKTICGYKKLHNL